MELRLSATEHAEECQVHGGHARKANKALLAMILASLSLIIWHVWVYGPTGHPENAGRAAGSFPFLVGSEMWDLLFNKRGILAELWEVFPYFIAGILLAGYFRTYKIAVKLQASLRKYGVLSVFIASFVGVITPLCACGTLTTAISLLFAGLPLAPVMALMVTSPLLSPSTYLITLNDLGPEWTVIRTIAALSMGIFAGLVTHFLRTRGFETRELFIEGGIIRGDFHDEDYPDERLRCNCRQKFGNRVAVRTGNTFLIFLAKSSEMLWMVGKYIIVGVTIGAIVERYMPVSWIYRFFGGSDPLSILWVTLGSVPMFLHQVSASSILAHIKGALDGTLDGGAALAFMIGGPVTAVPTMVLFWSIFKKRVFALYMFVCLAGTIGIATFFQAFVFVPGVDTGNDLLRGVSSLSGGKSAIIRKQDRNVRMVMDPAGKGTIATFRNDLESRGGVVFDSGYGRFAGESAERYDNRRYILNIAGWLEENGRSPAGSKILVYDTTGAAKLMGAGILSDLSKRGFNLSLTGRGDAPQITDKLLSGYGQLWLFGEGASRLTDAEVEAVSRFSSEGKGMLIVAGTGQGEAGVNRVSSRYGVYFDGSAEHLPELRIDLATSLFKGSSEILGKFLKLVHKA